MNVALSSITNNIIQLPDCLITIIYEYIPEYITVFLTKKKYLLNHTRINQYIPIEQKENYIRTLIRQDNSFVFNLVLKENFYHWIHIKKYYYKNCIYANYLYFLRAYCIDNESYNCLSNIDNISEQVGLSKNQHKKNHCKYIRWKI